MPTESFHSGRDCANRETAAAHGSSLSMQIGGARMPPEAARMSDNNRRFKNGLDWPSSLRCETSGPCFSHGGSGVSDTAVCDEEGTIGVLRDGRMRLTEGIDAGSSDR